jgi:hypothetical protein
VSILTVDRTNVEMLPERGVAERVTHNVSWINLWEIFNSPSPIWRTMSLRAVSVATTLALAVGGVAITAAPAAAADGTASISGVISGEAYGENPAASLGTGAQAVLLERSGADGDWSPVVGVQTDVDGRYEFAGLEAGEYSVTFTGFPTSPTVWAPENWDNQLFSSFNTAQAIDLEDGEAFTADAALTRTVRLGGLVTTSDTHAELTENDVEVRLYNVTGGDTLSDDYYVLTDGFGEAGWYSGAFLPGDYKLQFVTDDSTPYSSEWWNSAATRADATVITIAAGENKTDFATELERADIFTSAPTPTITGTAQVGSKLTAKTGAFAPTGAELSYDWKSAGVSVGTASTYTAAATDKGKKLTVSVTASKSGYKPITVTSKATKAVVGGVTTGATPKFTGTAKVGATLTAVTGTWKPASTGFTYQWLRSGKAIPDATAATYTLVSTDRGKKISLKVTGTSAGFSSVSKTSASKTVAYGTLTAAGIPTITGTAKVAETLTAFSDAWTPEGTTLSYQWNADKKAISGATSSTLVVPGSVAGKKITVTVSGKKSGYTTTSKTSVATVAVAKADLVAGLAPTVAGTPDYKATLTASATGWESTTKLSYQWLRDGAKISGATKATYTVGRSDRGHTISVTLTASRTGYNTLTATGADLFAIPALAVTVDDDPSEYDENEYYALYFYGTSPGTVTVGGGEYLEFHAQPGFFNLEEFAAAAVWYKGAKFGNKEIGYSVSPDGSTVRVKIPTGTLLKTIKDKKKSGYTVEIQFLASTGDEDYPEILGVFTRLKF